MHHISSHHEVMRLFEELSRDNLRTLTGIFGLLAHQPSLANYFEGIGVAHLHLKHDLCASCGESHGQPEFLSDSKEAAGHTHEPVVPSSRTIEEHAKLLNEYRMVETVVGDMRKFTCRDCGMEYVSLEDRMLRKPDECKGCQHKSAWG